MNEWLSRQQRTNSINQSINSRQSIIQSFVQLPVLQTELGQYTETAAFCVMPAKAFNIVIWTKADRRCRTLHFLWA